MTYYLNEDTLQSTPFAPFTDYLPYNLPSPLLLRFRPASTNLLTLSDNRNSLLPPERPRPKDNDEVVKYFKLSTNDPEELNYASYVDIRVLMDLDHLELLETTILKSPDIRSIKVLSATNPSKSYRFPTVLPLMMLETTYLFRFIVKFGQCFKFASEEISKTSPALSKALVTVMKGLKWIRSRGLSGTILPNTGASTSRFLDLLRKFFLFSS